MKSTIGLKDRTDTVVIRLPSGRELHIWLLDRHDMEVQISNWAKVVPGEYPEYPRGSITYDKEGNIVRIERDGCSEYFPNT